MQQPTSGSSGDDQQGRVLDGIEEGCTPIRKTVFPPLSRKQLRKQIQRNAFSPMWKHQGKYEKLFLDLNIRHICLTMSVTHLMKLYDTIHSHYLPERGGRNWQCDRLRFAEALNEHLDFLDEINAQSHMKWYYEHYATCEPEFEGCESSDKYYAQLQTEKQKNTEKWEKGQIRHTENLCNLKLEKKDREITKLKETLRRKHIIIPSETE